MRHAVDKGQDLTGEAMEKLALITDPIRADLRRGVLFLAVGVAFGFLGLMVGMEEGLLPHSRSVKSGRDEDIAEERRLCYVGITRAQEKLTLSLALTRRKWGKAQPTIPSQFLYEITGQAQNPN